MGSPGAVTFELTEESQKYDRQIRLWGDNGQSLVGMANVCLINVTALGAEILKGIVLPGIGGFMIVDDRIVSEDDIGSNFFLEPSDIGQSRAKCCAKHISELNPDCQSSYNDSSIESILESTPDFLKGFKAVVATSIPDKTIIQLSNILWDMNIPFFVCRSIGFAGIARIQIREHRAIETHPDNKQTDLRLQNPFPTLQQYLDEKEVNNKIPWIVILYKYLKQWREQSGKQIPTNYKEKTELRTLIKSGMTADEENFEEAVRAVNTCFTGGQPTEYLKTLFEDDACNNLNENSKIFWILTRSLRDFVHDNNGMLPVPGVIPDMTADTKSYIQLQDIYRQQAIDEATVVHLNAQKYLNELNLPIIRITKPDVIRFCREAATIGIVRGTKIADEYVQCTKQQQHIASELESSNPLMSQYLAMRVLDRYQTIHGQLPGRFNHEADMVKMNAISNDLIAEWRLNTIRLSVDIVHEMCRYGGGEMHSISAFLGGCIAHEIIKVVTKQYKIIDNTFVYNGITLETATFKM